MSTTLENRLFHQFKQNDYILFNINTTFADSLETVKASSYQYFKTSWNYLQPDVYLVDGGTFRLRRYSVFHWQDKHLQLVMPEAHFQSKHYNMLYGGINRVFAPITTEVLDNAFFMMLINANVQLFDIDAVFAWRVQCHQFRIKTSLMETGKPTPEGIHQDGADYVFIMLLERQSITGGVSELFDRKKKRIVSTTLTQEGDAILLNDRTLWHSVTNISPAASSAQGYRDVLVLTFHRIPREKTMDVKKRSLK